MYCQLYLLHPDWSNFESICHCLWDNDIPVEVESFSDFFSSQLHSIVLKTIQWELAVSCFLALNSTQFALSKASGLRGFAVKRALNSTRFAQRRWKILSKSDQSGGSRASWELIFPLDLLRANFEIRDRFRVLFPRLAYFGLCKFLKNLSIFEKGRFFNGHPLYKVWETILWTCPYWLNLLWANRVGKCTLNLPCFCLIGRILRAFSKYWGYFAYQKPAS